MKNKEKKKQLLIDEGLHSPKEKEEIEKAYIRHIQENKKFIFFWTKENKKLYKAKKSNDFHNWRERVFYLIYENAHSRWRENVLIVLHRI